MKTYFEYKPTVELRSLIDCYWYFCPTCEVASNPHKVIPDNRVDILFVENDHKKEVLFSGPMSKPLMATDRKIFGIRLKPEFTFGLFETPLSDFKDTCTNLELFFHDEEILSQIYQENDSLKFKIKALDQYFLNRLPKIKKDSDARIIKTTSMLELGYSLNQFKELTSISEQHIRRLFKKHVGISPKKYEKISRFQRAKKYLKSKMETNWADIAVHNNYYDQSHFIADCKELTNSTPVEYFI